MDYPSLLPFCKNDTQRQTLDAVIAAGSYRKAAKTLGIHRSNVARRIENIQRQAERQGLLGHHKSAGTVPRDFYAETSVQRRLNPATGQMEVVSDWTKSRLNKGLHEEAYIAMIEGLSHYITPAKPTAPNLHQYSSELASAIILGDPHIGVLAHAVETLGEDYDLDRSIADIRAAVDYAVDCAPASEEGWFINVGDLTHANDTKHVTPGHGNNMDMAARHNQTLRAAGAVIRYSISKMLTKFRTVKVVNARGNHDLDAAFAVNFHLEAIYENEPRVQVFGNDAKFNFIEFGKNLIMVNHGDGINDNRLAGTMTKLAAEAWGRSRYRRIWTGHIHHKTRREHDSGAVIESFPILPPTDEYHASHGYCAERGITMITLHREFGQVMLMEPSIEMIRAYQSATRIEEAA